LVGLVFFFFFIIMMRADARQKRSSINDADRHVSQPRESRVIIAHSERKTPISAAQRCASADGVGLCTLAFSRQVKRGLEVVSEP
jgi:hypothetical protein